MFPCSKVGGDNLVACSHGYCYDSPVLWLSQLPSVYYLWPLQNSKSVPPHLCTCTHTHTNVYMKFRLLLSYHQWYIRRIWQFIFSNSLFCSRKGIAGQPATWPSYDSFPINYSSYEIQMIVCKLHSSLNSFGWVFQRALSLKLLHLRNHTNQMDRSM